jgi:hypothetical protein
MKTLTRSAIVVALTLAIQGVVPALAAGPGSGPRGVQSRPALSQIAVALPALTADEMTTLSWLREEEKLARDVYRGLAALWADPIFARIATAEQRHFDALGTKIALYALTDPALPAVGLFANVELQAQYDQLMATGGASYQQALTVGATIEEMDIADLLAALAATTNPALQTTYQNLLAGSKNHLRAFASRLQALGQEYTPQCIDPVLFDAVVGN